MKNNKPDTGCLDAIGYISQNIALSTPIDFMLIDLDVTFNLDLEQEYLKNFQEQLRGIQENIYGIFSINPTDIAPHSCGNDWKTYDSGWSKYEYCGICDKKRHE